MDVDLLKYAVDYSIKSGAKYAEARYHLNNALEVVMRYDKVVGIGKSKVEGVGIRILYNGQLLFTSTNRLSRDAIKECIDGVLGRGKTLSSLGRIKGLGEAQIGNVSYEVKALKPLDYKPIDVKINELKECYKHAVACLKEATLGSFAVAYRELEEVKGLVTSDGAWVESKVPRVSLLFNFVLSHPQRGTIQRILNLAGSGGLELMDGWRVYDLLAEEVRSVERVLIDGTKPPTEPVDVVLGSEVTGLIAHESAGHPMEADRIWGREAAQAGESYVKPEMLGLNAFNNEFATVVDDPTMPKSYGFYLYDDEGVRARPKYIYLNGRLNEFLHNRWTALLFKTTSNGSARSMNYASEPIPRMSNTYLTPGDYTFEELIEDIDVGVYIKSYQEWNIDDVRWGQRYVGLESYMIRNGELAEPIRNPVVEFTTKAFYSNIVGKSKNLRFYPGECGKGEPPQGVPVWFGGPEVRLGKMRLGVFVQ